MSDTKTKEKTGSIKDIATRTNLYRVSPEDIEVEDGFNVREDYGDIDGLALSIEAKGVITPIRGRFENQKVILTDGHRRLRAIKKAIENGTEIKNIPCIIENKAYGKEERILDLIIANQGKPLEPVEEAKVIEKLHGLGWNFTEIATKTGKSQGHVSQLYAVSQLPKEVKKRIIDGKISYIEALNVARRCEENGEHLTQKIKELGNEAEKLGKKKITAKVIHGPKEPKPSKSSKKSKSANDEASNPIEPEAEEVKGNSDGVPMKIFKKETREVLQSIITAHEANNPDLLDRAVSNVRDFIKRYKLTNY